MHTVGSTEVELLQNHNGHPSILHGATHWSSTAAVSHLVTSGIVAYEEASPHKRHAARDERSVSALWRNGTMRMDTKKMIHSAEAAR